ncbi:MAG: hypothetical protein ABI870_01585, partial [Rhodanobacter sp.]
MAVAMGCIQVDHEACLCFAFGEPVAAVASAPLDIDQHAAAAVFQCGHQAHRQHSHRHVVVRRQHGKGPRQAGRLLAAFAPLQSFDRQPRHA